LSVVAFFVRRFSCDEVYREAIDLIKILNDSQPAFYLFLLFRWRCQIVLLDGEKWRAARRANKTAALTI
jgi:hypothetical protein